LKPEVSQKLLLGIGAAAVVGIVGFLLYFFRASDPAASGPIPYKKFDYGSHMQEQMRDYNRQPSSASVSSQLDRPTTP